MSMIRHVALNLSAVALAVIVVHLGWPDGLWLFLIWAAAVIFGGALLGITEGLVLAWRYKRRLRG